MPAPQTIPPLAHLLHRHPAYHQHSILPAAAGPAGSTSLVVAVRTGRVDIVLAVVRIGLVVVHSRGLERTGSVMHRSSQRSQAALGKHCCSTVVVGRSRRRCAQVVEIEDRLEVGRLGGPVAVSIAASQERERVAHSCDKGRRTYLLDAISTRYGM